MGLRASLSRVVTGTPKCVYCALDGIWLRAGQPVCDIHKADLAAMGFSAQPRRGRR